MLGEMTSSYSYSQYFSLRGARWTVRISLERAGASDLTAPPQGGSTTCTVPCHLMKVTRLL